MVGTFYISVSQIERILFTSRAQTSSLTQGDDPCTVFQFSVIRAQSHNGRGHRRSLHLQFFRILVVERGDTETVGTL